MHGIPGLYYAHVKGKGRGVFCATDIEIKDVIETCPVIILSQKDLKVIHETKLHDYYFLWVNESEECAIALGYGSLYNHSNKPNACFIMDFENQSVDFICKRKIPAGEEILIDYHEGVKSRTDLWFKEV